MTARRVVLLDGIDGAGKSTFAARIAAAAERSGVRLALLHVDDFRRPVAWGSPGRTEVDRFWHDYFDLDGLDECILAFEQGESATHVPSFDARSGTLGGNQRIDLHADIALVEGIFTLRLAVAVRAPLIYLTVSEPEAGRRVHRRDAPLGRTAADIDGRIARRYQPAQRRYQAEFTPLKQAAILIDNDLLDRPRLAHARWELLPRALHAPLGQALQTD